jgi:hypothetical protein
LCANQACSIIGPPLMPWTRAIVLVDIDASPFTVISIAAIVLKEENEIKHCAED